MSNDELTHDVTLFWEVNCKMRLFAMKYSIEFEEKINQYNSLLYRKKSKVTNTYVHGLYVVQMINLECEGKAAVHDNVRHTLVYVVCHFKIKST
jgi:hypothetical protein